MLETCFAISNTTNFQNNKLQIAKYYSTIKAPKVFFFFIKKKKNLLTPFFSEVERIRSKSSLYPFSFTKRNNRV